MPSSMCEHCMPAGCGGELMEWEVWEVLTGQFLYIVHC